MNRIRLERLRTPVGRQFMNKHKNLKVRIWSDQWGAYWRSGRCGYTYKIAEAGIYTLEEAYDASGHCGLEKHIEFEIYKDGDSVDNTVRFQDHSIYYMGKKISNFIMARHPFGQRRILLSNGIEENVLQLNSNDVQYFKRQVYEKGCFIFTGDQDALTAVFRALNKKSQQPQV